MMMIIIIIIIIIITIGIIKIILIKLHTNIEKNITIRQVQNFQYLGVSLRRKGINSEHIVCKICKGRQIIGCLNSLWWDKNVSLEKKILGKLWLNQWLSVDVKFGFLRERGTKKTPSFRNGLFKEVS